MIQFNVQDISKYRGQLMGIATLLVIFGHSVGNGVAMPRWMESLCGLSSVGVDIFLLVSGLGLWYSLTSLNGKYSRGWYLRRYKRILIPYLIIMVSRKYYLYYTGCLFIRLCLSYQHSVIGSIIRELGSLQC